MTFSMPQAELFVPDGLEPQAALARTTHLAIGAHHDDLEFFAFAGIQQCFGRPDRWFTGVTCTDGAGSSRSGPYAGFTDADMMAVRAREQRKAAVVGEYAAQIQLAYPSDLLKDPRHPGLAAELTTILEAARPEVVYLHNPADKHETHIAVLARSLQALRALPPEARPRQAIGCEVWRGLDWLVDDDKVLMPASGQPNLQAALNGVFDSQISGGKRYDLAVMGRRLANATFFQSHAVDAETGIIWGMDLTPLVEDPSLSVEAYVTGFIDRLRDDVAGRLRRYLPGPE